MLGFLDRFFNSKKAVLVTAFVFITAILVTFNFTQQNDIAPATKQPASTPSANSQVATESTTTSETTATTFTFTATQNQTALELLEAHTEVTYESYGDAGVFITSIGGKEGTDDYYWALYLNDEYATKGADQLELSAGDELRIEYEAVDQTAF